jgi:GMP synthase (glutamine-hydrolysing)
MTAFRILVVDGNTRAVNAANVAAGGSVTGERYVRVLQACAAELGLQVECRIVQPAEDDTSGLEQGLALDDFDGVAWTGSALNIYSDVPAVRRQIELARAAIAAGRTVFGSCWGLQVAAAALGGRVHRNPKGREIGVARRILRTAAGAAHPLLQSKPAVFDAICVHIDEVAELPSGMTVLAGNAISSVQAAEWGEVAHGGHVWAVQYHPEYNFTEIGAVIRRYAPQLLKDGLFADQATIDRVLADFAALQERPERRADLAWIYGLDDTVLQRSQREAELRNWLDYVVRPRAAGRIAQR